MRILSLDQVKASDLCNHAGPATLLRRNGVIWCTDCGFTWPDDGHLCAWCDADAVWNLHTAVNQCCTVHYVQCFHGEEIS